MNTYARTLAPLIRKSTHKPRLELTADQVKKLKTGADIILATIGIGGIMLVSAVAPNILQAFKLAHGKSNSRWSFEERRKKAVRGFYYLKDRDYLSLSRNKNDFKIELTDKGKKKIDKLKLKILTVKKPLFWDGKFWQVAADIPVKYRKGADALRKILKQMGFYSLQRTLWFYPYDPRKEIQLLAQEYKIEQFVTVMKISVFDYADLKVLRGYFKETGIIEL